MEKPIKSQVFMYVRDCSIEKLFVPENFLNFFERINFEFLLIEKFAHWRTTLIINVFIVIIKNNNGGLR